MEVNSLFDEYGEIKPFTVCVNNDYELRKVCTALDTYGIKAKQMRTQFVFPCYIATHINGWKDSYSDMQTSTGVIDRERLTYIEFIELYNKSTAFSINDLYNGEILFKLKPSTIMIGPVEVPAPFEPEEGQEVWFIDDNSECGYSRSCEYDSDIYSYYGWWRTEEEIKQVVSALRKLLKI